MSTSSDRAKKVEQAIQSRVEEVAGKSSAPKRPASANRLYALLIGVDKYASPSIRPLSGAVGDAERVKAFLREQDPPVSNNRIKFLKNEEATATHIIERIKGLRDEASIQHGDPILIYYAGHGSNLDKPEGWPALGSYIQCLTPHDARIVGETVENVVTDRAFGALLQIVAEKKGKNITVILDCCHSASGTREQDKGVSRGVEFKTADGKGRLSVSSSYQKEIWDDEIPRLWEELPEFANSGLQSHIILAACASNESAYEDHHTREGRFTTAFLRALKVAGTDTMTYTELMKRLEVLPSQTPQCEGREKDTRILFDRGIVQRDRPCYTLERSGGSYTLYAGEINGVSKGATFAAYPSRDVFTSGASPAGNLIVSKAGPIVSTLSPIAGEAIDMLEGTSTAVAVLIHVGNQSAFRVHAHPDLSDEVVQALAQEVLEPSNSDSSWVSLMISSRDTAHLSVIPGDDSETIGFEILDQRIRGLGLEYLNGKVSRDKTSLQVALRSAAHFFYHLRSSPEKAGLRRAVDERVLILHKGVSKDTDIPMPVYEPAGEPIDVKARDAFYPDMPVETKPRIQRTFYGIDVRNKSPRGGFGLFVWMFYLDCSTLGISKIYEPPSGHDVAPLLPAGMDPEHRLPLNFGEAGQRPLTFGLPEGQKTDVGFIRIFVSNHNANLSGIAQKPVVQRGIKTAYPCNWTNEPEVWDALTIPVVMK